MKLMKLLTSLLIISSFGCVSAPIKPDIDVCIVDYDNFEFACRNTKSKVINRKYLANINKYIAFSPDDWEKLKNHMDTLDSFIKTSCDEK